MDLLDEGVAILDGQSNVLFWNRAAAALTGRSAAEMIQHICPGDLYRVNEEHRKLTGAEAESCSGGALASEGPPSPCKCQGELEREFDKIEASDESLLRPTLVSMSHKLGHRVPGMLRRAALHGSDGRIPDPASLGIDQGSPRFQAAEALEKAALAELAARRPDRVLATNVEFWSAVILDLAQVPAELFTSMFTCARVAGWSAHVLEQKREGRLIRPTAKYVGEPSRPLADLLSV